MGFMMEISMRCLLPIAAAMLLLGAAPAMSQTVSPGMGTTSPLAVSPGMGTTSPLGGTGSVGQVGIPLGSTELNPGGLSPDALGSTPGSSLCGTNGTSVTGNVTPGIGGSGIAGSTSTFDGGGNAGVSGPCSSVPSGGTVSGTQNPFTSGTAAGSTLGIGTVPLGATELGGAGISPMVPGPGPAPTLNPASPCVGSGMATPLISDPTALSGGGTALSTPGTSPNGC
jgi:hypothetical protein